MIRRPPRSTRTDTLFPYTTLFRSTWFAGEPVGKIGIEWIRPHRVAARKSAGDLLAAPAAVTQPHEAARCPRQGVGPLARPIARRACTSPPPPSAAGSSGPAAARGSSRRTGRTRSEERRVGKERVSTCRSRRSPYHLKKKPLEQVNTYTYTQRT